MAETFCPLTSTSTVPILPISVQQRAVISLYHIMWVGALCLYCDLVSMIVCGYRVQGVGGSGYTYVYVHVGWSFRPDGVTRARHPLPKFWEEQSEIQELQHETRLMFHASKVAPLVGVASFLRRAAKCVLLRTYVFHHVVLHSLLVITFP